MAVILAYALLILKVILIIAAVILLILLLLITLILLAPIRYNVMAKYPQEVDKPVAEINLKWFLGALKCHTVYQDGSVKYIFKVFGMDIKNIKSVKGNKSAVNSKVKKDDGGKKSNKDVLENNNFANTIDLSRQHRPLLNRDNKEKESLEVKIEPFLSEDKPLDEGLNERLDNQKIRHNYKYHLNKLKKSYSKFKWNLKNICDIIKRIWNIKDKLESIFTKWIHKQTIVNVKLELVRLWNKIKPKYIKLHGKFGFDDPAITGKVSAIAAMLIPVFGESDFEIEPDFENSIVEMDVQIDGKLRLVYILVLIIRILKDKGNRYTFKILRRVKW